MEDNHTVMDTTLEQLVGSLKDTPGALLPILHRIQDQFGYVPDRALPIIAKALRCTTADVHGVISFYHHFRRSQPGRHLLEVCRAEACQARGAREFERHVKEKLRIGFDQTTADGEFTLKAVYCLGNCATGPSLRQGDRVLSRMNPERFDKLVEDLTTYKLELK